MRRMGILGCRRRGCLALRRRYRGLYEGIVGVYVSSLVNDSTEESIYRPVLGLESAVELT